MADGASLAASFISQILAVLLAWDFFKNLFFLIIICCVVLPILSKLIKL